MIKRIFFATLLFTLSIGHAEITWIPASTGIAYTSVTPNPGFPHAAVIAFKVDPSRYHFKSVLAKDTLNSSTAYVAQLGKQNNALIAINGGYFSTTDYPLGLRISENKVLSRIKKISWWGVFSIKNNTPTITASSQFSRSKNISFAVQAGPRLLINGDIPRLKPGDAQRSALGITKDHKVIVAITQNLPLSLTQWATLLKKIGCKSALNLDGGSSSQLYVNVKKIHFVIPNLKPVTDAVIVIDKQ